MGQGDTHYNNGSEDQCNKDGTEPPFEAVPGYRFSLRGMDIAGSPLYAIAGSNCFQFLSPVHDLPAFPSQQERRWSEYLEEL